MSCLVFISNFNVCFRLQES